QFHALRLHVLEQPFAVSADFALYFGEGRQFLAFGLADIEYVHGTEPNELLFWFTLVRCVIGIDIGRDFVLARPTAADHRGKNENAFLPALNEAAKRVPSSDSGNVCGIRLLSGN